MPCRPRSARAMSRSTSLGAVGHDELVLHEAARAVQPVPAGHRRRAGGRSAATVWSSPSAQRAGALRNHSSLKARTVSRLTRPPGTTDGAPSRASPGRSQRLAARPTGAARRGPRARRASAPTARARRPRGQDVDPGHGVRRTRRRTRASRAMHRVEVRRAAGCRRACSAVSTALVRERRRGDDAGQPHAADRGPEQLRVAVRADRAQRRRRPVDQLERLDVVAEDAGRRGGSCRGRRQAIAPPTVT